MSAAKLLDHFDAYIACGLRVIPVHPRTKRPIGFWTARYRPDRARHFLSRNPGCNVGILLGDGVVDVEGDTPEANRRIEDAIGGVEHPCYRSSKSNHHLFRCPDENLSIVKFDGIEFRGNRHFSVLPPSRHVTGVTYQWIREPGGELPPMPRDLMNLYVPHAPPIPKPPRKNCEKPHCITCGERCEVPRERFWLEVEAFKKHGLKWTCTRCRKIDVRDICRFLKRKARGRPC